MKTILVTAYAVNPYKGSEDGMGWNFIDQIAQSFRVIAITRKNNLPHIERYIQEFPEAHYENMTFLGFDLSESVLRWKKGEIGALAYFYMWQRSIPQFVEKQQLSFDLCHNLNFHNDWTPSFLWKLGKPFVWGPVGHHPLIPTQFIWRNSKKAWFKDRMRWMIKKAFWHFSPSLRKCSQHADLILAMNSTVADVLPAQAKRIEIMPSVGCEQAQAFSSQQSEYFEVLSVGRFVCLKAFDLTIKAFAQFFHQLPAHIPARLRLVGKGEMLPQMQQMITELGLEDVVEIIPWIERAELASLYNQADVFLFPSHEGAGMVVAEAMSYGLPVICLDNCGPGEFVDEQSGIAVPFENYDQTIKALAEALNRIACSPQLKQHLSAGAYRRFQQQFDWNQKGKLLRTYYHQILQINEKDRSYTFA